MRCKRRTVACAARLHLCVVDTAEEAEQSSARSWQHVSTAREERWRSAWMRGNKQAKDFNRRKKKKERERELRSKPNLERTNYK